MEQPSTNPYAAPQARLDDNPESAAAGAPAPALWDPESGGAWCLLLSVAFGSWVMMQNWSALGESERASTAKVWFIVSLIVLPLVMVIPDFRAVGFLYLVIWYFAQNRPQIQYVKEHFGKDYPHRPWTKVALLALVLVFGAAMLLGTLSALLFTQ